MHIILIYFNFYFKIMSHKMLRLFIIKVFVSGYFPLPHIFILFKIYFNNLLYVCYILH